MTNVRGTPLLLLSLLTATTGHATTVITATSITTNTRWGSGAMPPETEYVIAPSSGTTLTLTAGNTLTIDPGTTIRMGPDVSLILDGTMIANGTGPQPIVFRVQDGFTQWGGISIGAGGAAAMSNCTVQEFGTYPVTGTIPQVAPLFGANTFVARGDGHFNAIQLRASTIAASITLSKPPASFCYATGAGTFDVRGGASPVLTIADRTTIKWASGALLRVGDAPLAGGLKAKEVVFTSVLDDTLGDLDNDATPPGPQQWEGIRLDSATLDAQTVIDGCTIRYGGNGPHAGISLLDCEPTVTRCLIESNYLRGIGVHGTSSGTAVTGNILRNNSRCEIVASMQAMEKLVPSNTVVPSADGKWNAYELIGSTITASMTLPRPPIGFCYVTYTFGGGIFDVRGAAPVLTIADGTLIKFTAGSLLSVGHGGLAGGLKARGVVFTSSQDDTLGDLDGDATAPAPQQWEGIMLGPTTIGAQTSIDSCTIRYGGNGPNAGISVFDCEPTIQRCLIAANYTRGMSVSGTSSSAAGISGNVFRDNLQCEILSTPQGMVNLVPNNTFAPSLDGRWNGLELGAATIAESMTLPRPPGSFCYVTSTSGSMVIDVRGLSNPVLTIADRTVIKFTAGDLLRVGYAGVGGGLRAKGVVFTSVRDDTLGDLDGDDAVPAAQQWEGIRFEGATIDAQTVLDSCTIRYGGNDPDAGIYVLDCEPTITRCLIERNHQRGIRVEGSASAIAITNNLVRRNTTYEIRGQLVPVVRLASQNTIARSDEHMFDAYEVIGGTVPTSISIPPAPDGISYYLLATVVVPAGNTLTIAAGNVIKLGIGASLLVPGTLVAIGDVTAPHDPIVFTSIRDDSWWNDTNGDGTATAGAAGNWGRVELSGMDNPS